MERKGNAIWIVLDSLNDARMNAVTCEVYENGEVRQISHESITYSGIIELAETFFSEIKELRSVMITLKICFNPKALGKVRPRFCITRNQDGSYKFKVYQADGKVREILYISPEKLRMTLQIEMLKFNNQCSNQSNNRLSIGAII